MSKRAIKLDGEIPAARRQPKKEAPKKPLTEKELEKAWRLGAYDDGPNSRSPQSIRTEIERIKLTIR
jgi:hypothetical protein